MSVVVDDRLRMLSVDGMQMPWYTRKATAYLEAATTSDARVFEWGCGSSTIWWANRAKEVVSVEHDKDWHAAISAREPRAEILHRPLGPGYERAIANYDPFDVVVVDGRRRGMCAEAAVGGVKDSGIIVWDNSDRDQYAIHLALIESHGFAREDFLGQGHGRWHSSPKQWCTSVFFKA